MKKFKFLLIIGILLVTICTFSNVKAAIVPVSNVDTNDEIDLKYSSSILKSMISKNSMEVSSHFTFHDSYTLVGNNVTFNVGNVWVCNLPATNAWVKYNGIVIANGKKLDLKVTILGNGTTYPECGQPQFMAYSTGFTLRIGHVSSVKLKFEFFESGTNTLADYHGYMTCNTIDLKQYLNIQQGVDRVLLSKNTRESYTTQGGNTVINGPDEQMVDTITELTEMVKYMAQFLMSNEVVFTFGAQNYPFQSQVIGTTPNPDGGTTTTTKYIYELPVFSIVPYSLGHFEQPTPIKTVDKTTASIGDKITYNITQRVPMEGIGAEYGGFVISDTIPTGLTVDQSEITIKDEYGNDVSSRFNIELNDNNLQVKAKMSSLLIGGLFGLDDFYGFTYTVSVPCTVNSNLSGSTTAANGTIISNSAKVTIDDAYDTYDIRGAKDTNSVSTEIKFKITTEKDDNATVTSEITNIKGGDSKDITYAPKKGYLINKLIVDGTEVDFTPEGGTYTFSNISGNHTIRVETKVITRKIKIIKNDKETGATPQGGATFTDARYGIYKDAACTKLLTEVTIGFLGSGTSVSLPVASYENGVYTYYETYYVKEIQAPIGYLLDTTIYPVYKSIDDQETDDEEIEVTVLDQVIKNNVEVTKYIQSTDSTDKSKLKGAKFKAVLKSDTTKIYYSTETDSNGVAVFKNLPFGIYEISESTIPAIAFEGKFYIGSEPTAEEIAGLAEGEAEEIPTSFDISVEEDSSTSAAIKSEDIIDIAKKMKITIVKEDSVSGANPQGDAHLEGAEYGIYKDRACTEASKLDTLVIEKKADGTYQAASEKKYLTGTYYIKEIKAPLGYNLDTTVYEAKVDPATQVTEEITKTVTVKENVIKNDIEIHKYLEATNSSDKKPLAGVEFVATLKSNAAVKYSATTDTNGYCKIENVPYGVYEIKETIYPDEAYNGEFTVGADPTRVQTISQSILVDKNTTTIYSYGDITNVAKKMKIEISRTDAEKGLVTQGDAQLEDAEYTIYKDSNCTLPIETVVIKKQSNGSYKATSKEYLTGTYYIKETKASVGYKLDNKKYEVTYNPATQMTELVSVPITVSDKVIRNSIDITKYLEGKSATSKTKLPGVEFSATLVSTNSPDSYVEYKATTDANGHCVIENLPYGTYRIWESVIPANAYGGFFTVGNSGLKVKEFTQFIEFDKDDRSPYKFEITNLSKSMKIEVIKEDSLTKFRPQGDAHLEGAQYTIYSDSACTNAVQTLTTSLQADGTYRGISTNLSVGLYYVKETKASTGYNLDEKVYKVQQEPSAQIAEDTTLTILSKEVVIKNDIGIYKFLESTASTAKTPLKGVEFTATLNSNPAKSYKGFTDENGYCLIKNLPYGTYTLTETISPDVAFDKQFIVGNDGVRRKTITHKILVDKKNTTIYSYGDITNIAKKMNIVITKEDEEKGKITQGDAHLEGAEYTIYRDKACTSAVETVTTAKQADGTYKATTQNYLTGTYYIKETKAPIGYNLDTRVHTVEQKPELQTSEYITIPITLTSRVKRNNIDITKYLQATDSTPKQFLEGAEFTAQLVSTTSPDSAREYKAVTDVQGRCVIENLPYGTYKIWESKIPSVAFDGQFTVGTSITRVKDIIQFVELDSSERGAYTYTDLTDVSKKLQIVVTKEDAESNANTQGDAVLDNAEYTIYKDEFCTEPVETITTSLQADGSYKAISSWHLSGTYYVKETKAPTGYNIDKTIYKVEQDPQEQVPEKLVKRIVSKDKVIKNDIEIFKFIEETDSTSKKPLSGVTFKATLNSDNTVVFKATTDVSGYCKLQDLPYGRYTITEEVVADESYNGEFTVDGDTTRVTTISHSLLVDKKDTTIYSYGDVTNVAKKMQITLYKEDLENGLTTQGEGQLEGAEYTFYRDKNCSDPIETVAIEKLPNGKYGATSGVYMVGTYYVKETKPSVGYNIDRKVYEVSQNPVLQTTEISKHELVLKGEVKKNSIEITKYLEQTDSKAKSKLGGVEFSAQLVTTTSPDSGKVYKAVTDSHGDAVLKDLPYGTYVVWESKVPDVTLNGQFTIGDDPTRVTEFTEFIELDDTERGVYRYTDITNVTKKMQITIAKEDAETGRTTQGEAHLEGAEFTIYSDVTLTDPVETVTIEKQADGSYKATSGWYLSGTYYVKETKAPTGYNIDQKVYTVTQDASSQVSEKVVKPDIVSKSRIIKNDIEIYKYIEATDSTEKTYLSGVEFTATLNVNPTKKYKVTTDENGYCKFTNLPYGAYTITETVTPDNAFDGQFVIGDDPTRVKIISQNILVDKNTTTIYSHSDVINIAKKMDITIYKEDIDNGLTTQGDAKLEGAEFTIYRDINCTDAVEVVKIEKQDDGKYSAKTGTYMVGAYYVKETKAPTGYNLDTKVYQVIQDPAAQTEETVHKTITSKSEVKKNSIDITKYIEATDSSAKQKLVGAEFSAQLVSRISPDSSKIYKATTDSNGHCVIENLPYGTYKVWESKVPSAAYDGQFTVGTKPERIKEFTEFIELDDTERGAYRYSDLTDVAKKMQIVIYKEDKETGETTQGDAYLEAAEYTIYKDSACTKPLEKLIISRQLDGTFKATSGWYLSGTYYVKETKAPIGYNIDEKVYKVSQDPATQTEEQVVKEIVSTDKVVKNDIEIYKYLEGTIANEKTPLAGVEFSAILNSDPDKIYKVTTDENGYCRFVDLPYGIYTITETVIPDESFGDDIIVGDEPTQVKTISQNILVDKNVTTIYSYADVTNTAKKMNITIYKEDKETGSTTQGEATLEGAEYTLYRNAACTDAIETVTIEKQADGRYSATSSPYRAGTYYIKETKAPVGYLIDERVYMVTQSAEDQDNEYINKTITSKNQVIRNDIDITKYLNETSSTDKTLLKGAEFSAQLVIKTVADSDKIYKATTDENGHCVIENLPYGTYKVWESVVPDKAFGAEFTIGYNTEVVKSFEQFIEKDKTIRDPYVYEDLTDTPKKMQIIINKEDIETGKTTQGDAHLEGAEFTIYRDRALTDPIETVTIEEGTYTATTQWYLVGQEYYIKETKAPEGYLIDRNVYIVMQNAAEQTEEYSRHEITSKSYVIRNEIQLTKYLEETYSSEKQVLEGVEFKAQLVSTHSPDSTKEYKATTDENGYCVIKDLPYGTYNITESVIPDLAYDGQFTNGEDTERIKEFTQFVQYDKSMYLPYRYTDLTNVAKKMQIVITKEDTETHTITQGDAHLEGAEYTVYRDEECTQELERLTIEKQEDGTYSATSNWYLTGTYYVKETKAPVGYNIDENVYTVAQDPAEQREEKVVKEMLSTDTVIKNGVEIYKYIEATDSTEKTPLAGVEFSATLNSDTTKVYKATTDENGYCKILDLPYGTYTITETLAPDNAYDKEFIVGEDGTRVKVISQNVLVDKKNTTLYSFSDITNIAKKMNITIYKEDVETGVTTQGEAHLEGAEYTIYRDIECTDAVETVTIEKQADGRYSATSGWYMVGEYYVKETKASVGYLIDNQVYRVEQRPVLQTTEYSSHNIVSKSEVIRNDIDITKYIEATNSTEKQVLAGAEFSAQLVTRDVTDSSKVYKAKTDDYGHCVIENLPYGTYKVWESKVPNRAFDGQFTIGTETERVKEFTQFIEVDKKSNDPYVYEDITDVAKKMKIVVNKEDIETGKVTQGDATLEGAEYTIYKDLDCRYPIETITIEKQADGTYSAQSKWYMVGTYYVKETKAPVGYMVDEKVYTVSQDPEAQTVEHTTHTITSKDSVIRNSIEIFKNVEATKLTKKKGLAGVVFKATLNADKTKEYYSTVTNDEGYCIISDLPYGQYTIVESTTPAGALGEFIVNGERVTSFEQFIEKDKSISKPYTFADITDVAKKTNIVIKIEDDETGSNPQGASTLEGAEYTIYADEECTQEIMKVTTSKLEDGTYGAIIEGLPSGDYYVKETKAPEGYLIDENVYPAVQIPSEQNEETVVKTIVSKNKVMKGIVRIIKYNNNSETTDKEPAVGAKIRLTLDANTEVYFDGVIDEHGFTEFKVPYGVYTVSEAEASDSGENTFINVDKAEIKYDGQIQRLILDDEYVRMKLSIKAYDGETKRALPGATFKIWNVRTQSWYEEMIYPSAQKTSEFVTDENGQITINNHLEAGSYILYETKAPNGYVVEDSTGYDFTIAVEKDGRVMFYHKEEERELEYDEVIYDSENVKMYKHTINVSNVAQRAVIQIVSLSDDNEGTEEAPVYLAARNVRYNLVAARDIATIDGTVRYSQGQVVSKIVTDKNGIGMSDEVYIGEYIIQEVNTQNAQKADVNIEYTTQDEKVQKIEQEMRSSNSAKEDMPVTGDIAVVTLSAVLIISIVGISFIMIKNKKEKC